LSIFIFSAGIAISGRFEHSSPVWPQLDFYKGRRKDCDTSWSLYIKKGYALDDEEYNASFRCVAVSIFDHTKNAAYL
jgi:hypothetical protein